MKAHEVLKRYADGRRDFRGEDLRGQSFNGKDLSGANFSEADIQGANFTDAMLRSANFSGVKAGLQRRRAINLVIVSWLLSGLLGIFSAFTGYFVALISIGRYIDNIIAVLVCMIAFAVFSTFTINKGLVASAVAVAGTGAFTLAGTGAFTVAVAGVGATTITGAFIVAVAGAGAVAGAITVAVAGAGAVTFAIAVAVAGARAGAGAVAGAVTFAVAGASTFAIAVARARARAGASTFFAFAFGFDGDDAGNFAGMFAGAVALLSAYIGWRALAGNETDAWLREIAIAYATTGGTSFRNADLTNADFTSATLKGTDFRNATLTRTNFHKVKKLDRARVGNTILIDAKVRDLVITHQGARQSYVGRNLKGANLAGAYLSDADLTEADISGATLQGAWLERANLTKTQALNTNFNEAHLTGACLEAWNINSRTHLEDAICDYIYLLNYHRERRPSSGEFAPGEFTKLFQEVLTTVDLIFRNGIDWKAFVLSLNAVQAKNEGTELSLQSIANKGDGVVVARLNVSEEADKEKIHSDFMQSYELALKAVEETYKAKLNAKDEQIEIYRKTSSEMKEIVGLLANRPINVDVKAIADSKSMNDSTDQSRNIKIGDISGDFNASGQALNLGEISGTVTNTINQLPTSSEPGKPGIKELLAQLQAAIDDPNLAEDDKAQALEQIKVLAEAGQNPNNEAAQKQAKKALGFLKVIAEGVPSAAKLVEAWKELLPAIAHFFGL